MLLRFIFENYCCYKDRQIFTMVSNSKDDRSNRIIVNNDITVLKGSFLFGANASGKSTFIKAVRFAANIVKNGYLEVNRFNKIYFRIDPQYKNKPGVFQFDILVSNKQYSYGFVIDYNDGKIISEWLYELYPGSKDTCIFDRDEKEITTNIVFEDEASDVRFTIYKEDVPDNKLFLKYIADKMNFTEKNIKFFSDIYNWFKRLIFIFPNTHIKDVSSVIKDNNGDITSMLYRLDTGIEDISEENVNFNDVLRFMPDEMKKSIMDDINNTFNKINNKITINIEINHHLYRVYMNENDDLVTTEIRLNHGNKSDLFSFSDESDGTKRLFDLIPIIQKNFMKDVIIFIDELDRSFHSKLTREFIRMFYETPVKNNNQMIACLHDINVLDFNILQKDEIWMVERLRDHSSDIYPMNKFKINNPKTLLSDYLLGRFGGVPMFINYFNDEEDL